MSLQQRSFLTVTSPQIFNFPPSRDQGKESRTIICDVSLYNKISSNGIKIGDSCSISPLFGKKRTFHLQRTFYHFSISHLHDLLEIIPFNQEEISHYPLIKLPGLKGDQGNYFLEWVLLTNPEITQNQKDQTGEVGAFYLQSLEHAPLRMNQYIGSGVFMMEGDLWEIGGNKIRFSRMNKDDKANTKSTYFAHLLKKSKTKSLLLEGETGTGKTYFATQVYQSLELKGPFIHLHVASLNPSLIESELFGHVKGSFTGAVHDKKGAFLQAEGGVLFLDEIDSIPKDIQTKLLLALDSGRIRPVGSTKDFIVHPYLIFASGQSLKHCVEKGEMRNDFFFRLQTGLTWKLKALRDNPQLIHQAIEQWLAQEQKMLSSTLLKEYMKYSWPGNLRQLFAHLEKKGLITEGSYLKYDGLDEELFYQHDIQWPEYDEEQKWETLETLKRTYVKKVISHFGDNLERSAQVLGISLNTIKKYSI
jgi:hypothetical protein